MDGFIPVALKVFHPPAKSSQFSQSKSHQYGKAILLNLSPRFRRVK
jgi:hypothetical protein